MVCSYRPRPDDGDSSGLVGRANKRITETQGGSTYWTRQVDRHRRDVGQKRGDPLYVSDTLGQSNLISLHSVQCIANF